MNQRVPPPSSVFPPGISDSNFDANKKSKKDYDTQHDDDGVDPDRTHDLEAGDHVVRWTHIALYPIQVHGIVLSAGPELVTLVDFGIASQSRSSTDRSFGPSASAADDEAAGAVADEEARAVASATGSDRRLEIITLTEEKDIKRWRKVNYGSSLSGGSKLQRLVSSILPGGGGGGGPKDKSKAVVSDSATSTAAVVNESSGPSPSSSEVLNAEARESAAQANAETEGVPSSPSKEKRGEEQQKSLGQSGGDPSAFTDGNDAATCTSTKEANHPPSLPKSDPKGIVIARVRYLLQHESIGKDGKHCNSVLPPYHLFYANSECLAVFCKTGRFSTLQAAIFLHSTAIGQVKSAATLSLFVASQTVPVTATVPAAGVLGWFGMTTTTTTMVPMLTASPWLIPALAGYGLAAVGTPYLILMKAKGKWEESTKSLNEGFWEWAGPDVYIDAIKGWGCLGGEIELQP
mmetsp:Transcript_32998/g.72376  ORF Transcript_32998/g.72376 Transcript_32998/m.72376 type:complete len:462 (+) Transcript_32998:175-1560(+)